MRVSTLITTFVVPIHSQKRQTTTMGCCGGDEDEATPPPAPHSDLLEPLTSSISNLTVISPMNSNFSALLCKDTLRAILQNLPVSDLARAACVCRLWRSVASDRDMHVRAFMAPWSIKRVVGDPCSGAFWKDNSISKFAISHKLGRGESVASLAVKYSVQVVDIKRLNNMMSDHGVHSRERLLIPLSDPTILKNSACYIEMDTHAKREVAVLYPDGGPGPDQKVNGVLSSRLTTERGKRRIIDTLKRSMRVDDGTAQYYLSMSNGDPRAALTRFSEDLTWERQVHLP